jgi:hypothetical protein
MRSIVTRLKGRGYAKFVYKELGDILPKIFLKDVDKNNQSRHNNEYGCIINDKKPYKRQYKWGHQSVQKVIKGFSLDGLFLECFRIITIF